MFDRLLVPLDGSAVAECVLSHVPMLARAFGARVTLLHVVDAAQLRAPSGLIDPLEWQVDRSEAQAYLDSTAARLRAEGLEVQALLREGRAPAMIIDHAQAADLIVLSTHGQGGYSHWGMGSIAQKVLIGTDSSVLLVRAGHGDSEDETEVACRYQRVLVPLDGSVRAEAVLPPVAALARSCDAQLLITHVVGEPEMPRRLPPREDEMSLVRQLTEYNTRAATDYLKQVESRLPSQSHPETRLLKGGNVAALLHQVVEQERVDLVALCAHGYTGNNQWRFGGIATSFITYGTTTLLILQDMPASRAGSEPGSAVRGHEVPLHGML